MSTESSSVISVLAGQAVAARERGLPQSALDGAGAVILDWFAAAVGGSLSAPAQGVRQGVGRAADPEWRPGTARVVGSGEWVNSVAAALINGTASHALEIDDIYSPGLYHPGAPGIAAALAAAEDVGASGTDLLRATAIGYEVGNRIAECLGASHYRYWHSTGTVGTMTAAAAAAEILELDAEQFAHAVALAATMAAGLQQSFRADADAKPLHSGHAAQAGLAAALSAQAGVTGALAALDGEIGLGAVMAEGVDWARAREEWPDSFLVEQTTVKPYPCCGHTFAAIDGILELREQGLTAENVESIRVGSYRAGVETAGIQEPTTPYEAKFSISHTVASALLHGTVDESTFTDEAVADPAAKELRGKILVEDDPRYTDPSPALRGAGVTVRTTDGQELNAHVRDRRGSPSNPVTPQQLEAKLRANATPALGEVGAAKLLEQLRDLTAVADIRTLHHAATTAPSSE